MADRKLTASDFLEREAGGDHHNAVLLADLESAAYAAFETFSYMADAVPADWLAACKLIAETELAIFPGEATA